MPLFTCHFVAEFRLKQNVSKTWIIPIPTSSRRVRVPRIAIQPAVAPPLFRLYFPYPALFSDLSQAQVRLLKHPIPLLAFDLALPILANQKSARIFFRAPL